VRPRSGVGAARSPTGHRYTVTPAVASTSRTGHTTTPTPGSSPIRAAVRFSCIVTETVDAKTLEETGLKDLIVPEKVVPMLRIWLVVRVQALIINYSALVGRYGRVFIGLSVGWLAEKDITATGDDIAEHFHEVSQTTTTQFPATSTRNSSRSWVALESTWRVPALLQTPISPTGGSRCGSIRVRQRGAVASMQVGPCPRSPPRTEGCGDTDCACP
jgi:hypothetical protein